jgi:hypothetical protein
VKYSTLVLVLSCLTAAAPSLVKAQAGVGVTSMTDGTPTSQQQAESERVLRVGLDMQVSERVLTKANDRAHLVFFDGTSVTLGPDSELVIDKFSYDAGAKSGEMVLTVTRGTFRFVGGAISKNSEVVINTPSSVLGIRGGIATANVTPSGTTANFLYGTSLRASNQGGSQTATRAGSRIAVAFGGVPGAATVVGPGDMPRNDPLEHQGPPARQPRSLSRANQTLQPGTQFGQALEAGASSDSSDPTPNAASPSANDTSNTQSGSELAPGDDALRNSILAKRNSGLTPQEARVPVKVVAAEGERASLPRPNRAAAPAESSAPKVPHALASPHGNPAQRAVATHVAAATKGTVITQSATTKR